MSVKESKRDKVQRIIYSSFVMGIIIGVSSTLLVLQQSQ